MGYRIRLMKVSGMDVDSVCAVFGLARTVERESVPDGPAQGLELEDGSFLLWRDDDKIENFELEYQRIEKMAAQSELLIFDVNETTMYSALEHWRGGEVLWDITRNNLEGPDHLVLEGDAPEAVQKFVEDERQRAKDAEGDGDRLFDVPVALFAALGGVRYDQDPPGDDPEPWIVLEPLSK